MTEFPTDWHREAYVAALEREIEGARRSIEAGEQMIARAKDAAENATRELTRVRKPSRRPASATETR
jgi:multidrug resistance efflux pump